MPPERKTRKRKANKAPSIYDVAREARVSVFTVSAVVNGKAHVGKALKQRVDAAILKLNYRPNLLARYFENNDTHTTSIVITDIKLPFYPVVVRVVKYAAHNLRYIILLC